MERINDLIRASSNRPELLRDFARWCAARAYRRADMSISGASLAARLASAAADRAAAEHSAALPHLLIANAIDAAGYARAAVALSAGRGIESIDAANDAERRAQREYLSSFVGS